MCALVLPIAIVRGRLPKLVPRSQSLIYGAFMGAGAIASMLLPQPIAPGMFADMRSGLIAVAGFFEGPLAALPDFLNVKDLDGRFIAANPVHRAVDAGRLCG
jgi:hypothetical protein